MKSFFVVDAYVTGVTIKDFLLDGNRLGIGVGPEAPDTLKQQFMEIDLGASGVSSTTVSLDFQDSPGYGVNAASYTTIQYCNAYRVGLSTVYASGSTYNVYVWFNYFYDNGGGAVAVYTRGGWIYSNQFINNHKEFPHLNPGGQLMLGEGSRSYYVYYNWFNGQHAGRSCAYFPCPDPNAPYYPGYEYTSGMEIYGAAHYFYGNHVTSHRGDGIDLVGVNSPYFGGQPGDVVQVRSDPVNLPNYRVENNWGDGIGIQNQAGGYLTSNVTINGIKSEYNTYAGVAFYNTPEVGPILGISIDNCCLLNNGGGPIRYLGGGSVQVTIGCTTCNCP